MISFFTPLQTVIFTHYLWGYSGYHRTRICRRNFANSTQHGLRLVLYAAFLQACGCDGEVVEQKPTRVVETGSDYVPLTHEMIVGARLHRRTGIDRKYDDLQWRFEDETFHIHAGKNGLPPDLREALLPGDVDAQEIVGRWDIEDNIIACDEIEVDGKQLSKGTRYLSVMRGPPLRIGTDPQYEFVHSQP